MGDVHPPAEPRPDPRGAALTTLCSLALGLWLLQDALLSGGRRVVGAPETETWSFLWGWYWMATSVVDQGRWPFHNDLLGHPEGGLLWLKAPLQAFLMIPLTRTLGPAVAHSLAQLLVPTFAALAAFLLARRLGADRLPAVVGGLLCAWCPHTLGELYNGNMEALDAGWMAAWLLLLVHLLARPTPLRVLGAGLALWALALSNQYYTLASGPSSALVALVALARYHGRPGRAWVRPVLASLAAVCLGLALFAPAGRAIVLSLADPQAITNVNMVPPRQPPYVTDLVELWRPLSAIPDHRGVVTQFQDLVYPGFALVGLALLAPLLGRRGDPWRLLWPALGTGYLVLSLGPLLYMDGERVGDDVQYWLPWKFLVEDLPVLDKMTLPHRMAVPAALFWGLSAAWALTGLARRLPGPLGAMAAPVAGALCLAEILALPPYRVPLATMEAPDALHARLLADLPGEGAVLQLPLPDEDAAQCNALRVYMWFQTLHGRPTVNLMDGGRLPPVIEGSELARGPLSGLIRHRNLVPLAGPAGPDPAASLRAQGVGWIVLNPDLVGACGPGRAEDWQAALGPALGPGVVLADRTVLYPLGGLAVEEVAAQARALAGEEAVLGVTTAWWPLLQATAREEG